MSLKLCRNQNERNRILVICRSSETLYCLLHGKYQQLYRSEAIENYYLVDISWIARSKFKTNISRQFRSIAEQTKRKQKTLRAIEIEWQSA